MAITNQRYLSSDSTASRHFFWLVVISLYRNSYYRASDISRKKKQNFAGFSGANSRKNRPISRDFRGENKSKFAKKSADFAGVYRQKVKFRRIFRGKFAEKSADFTGNFGGKLRQETINKKQPISLDFFWQISLKSINFASI